MRRLIILVLNVLLFCSVAVAQNVEFNAQTLPDKKIRKYALKMLDNGDKLYYAKTPDYTGALNCFLEAYAVNKNNALLNYKIGKCISSYNKKDGIPYLQASFDIMQTMSQPDKNIYLDLVLLMAKACHFNYEFETAIDFYQLWLANADPNNMPVATWNEVNNNIARCNSGISLVKNPVRAIINNLGNSVNGYYKDFSAVCDADNLLWFCSTRPQNPPTKKKVPVSNIYCAEKQTDGSFGVVRLLGEPFNSGKDDIITDISYNGKYALISRNGDIYYSIKNSKGQWTKFSFLDNDINTDYDEHYASFGKDMRSVFFVSNKPGGFGGYDIYRGDLMLTRNGGLRCVNVVNLGENINSEFDEICVSFSKFGNKMFVSSNNTSSIGGFDVFKAIPQDGSWSPLINIGYPVNTTGDDLYYVPANDDNVGFYTVEDATFDTDLYSVDLVDVQSICIMKEINGSMVYTSKEKDIETFGYEDAMKINSYVICPVSGTFFDTIANVPLSLSVDVINNETLHVIASFETQPNTGKYSISLPSGESYGFIIHDNNYLFCPKEITIPGSSFYVPFEENFFMHSYTADTIMPLNYISFIKDNEKFNMEKSAGELFRLLTVLKTHANMKVEIYGKPYYSLKVCEYLIDNGIDADRVSKKLSLENGKNLSGVRFY